MTDTTKRDAVLNEYINAVRWTSKAGAEEVVRLRDHEAMADEIVRLRAALKAQEANRLAALDAAGLRAEFEHHGCDTLQWVADALAAARRERDRAHSILAALREPSESVTKAALSDFPTFSYYGDEGDPMSIAIRAAVAAAEQEVDRD